MPSRRCKYVNKLSNSRILVLGASTGIGFCVAEAALEHGATVIISSSSEEKLDNAAERLRGHLKAIGSSSNTLSYKTCDLRNKDTLEHSLVSLLEFATADGKLDHIVYTAGDTLKPAHVASVTPHEVYRSLEVRYAACILLAKHLPQYTNPSISSSLTVTSGTTAWRPPTNWGILSGVAGAIEALSRGLAVDLRPIRVNCVQAGPVLTEAFEGIPPNILERMKKQSITATIGKPEEIAEAYIYCMKDTYATGAIVQSNGGRLVGDSA